MVRWEYRVVTPDGPPDKTLNDLGADGWEAFVIAESVVPRTNDAGYDVRWMIVFKRPI